MGELLWQPTGAQVEGSRMEAFRRRIEATHTVGLPTYPELHRWSIENTAQFWTAIWDFAGVVASQRGEHVLVDGDDMLTARWFPDARLNFAENLLRRRDQADAIVFWGEDRVRRRLSFAEVYDAVSRLVPAMRACGVEPGDRVAAYMPNMPETVLAMLATAAIGATWCSGSPDFGVAGILDRFGQVEPKVLFSADGYFYNGKRHDSLGKLAEVRRALPSVRRVVVVSYTSTEPDIAAIPDAVRYEDFAPANADADMDFPHFPFDHPLYIMFSSGTTGAPKCIVHGAGGTLLQHLKEHMLHTDLRVGERIFYFTTCGWMMWNWLVSALAAEATLLLYDGAPFHPDGNVLFDFAEEERANVFGTSAKYIDAVKKAGLAPRRSHDLSALRAILSTGSPLLPESFEFVYREVKPEVCLSSISGGTDIISCFALGNPTLPVHAGELQCRGLGMAVEVWNDAGEPVRGEKGELVCVKPFPSRPLEFWNDPDGHKYRGAYFDRFPGVWCHGDFAELTANEGLVIYGRSDAVLNPGGVRIGTAEIYRQVEQLEEIVEALVIGQQWDNDVRVVLFLRLKPGLELDDELCQRVRDRIRRHATPRHVPSRILQVDDIPRTRSGKIVELAVRDLVHGREIRNIEALANPEALEQFRDREELAS